MKDDILESWALVTFLPLVIVAFVAVVASFGILTNYAVSLIHDLTGMEVSGGLLLMVTWVTPIITYFWWANRRIEKAARRGT